MKVLVVDVGGSHVKILATGEQTPRAFVSGHKLTPGRMVAGVVKLAADWTYDVVSLGYPGVVVHGRAVSEPHNLAPGWVKFDFEAAFGRPTRLMNDAAMQALGSYQGGKMLFLGLGTGLGSAMIVEGVLEPLEIGHLPYRKGTYEDYLGEQAFERRGKKKWREDVRDVVTRLAAALEPSEVVIGGGNVTKLGKLPNGWRAGENANAFVGGFRIWDDPAVPATQGMPEQPADERETPAAPPAAPRTRATARTRASRTTAAAPPAPSGRVVQPNGARRRASTPPKGTGA